MTKAATTQAWREPNKGTAYKETDKGPLFLDFRPWRITAVRPLPARAWQKRPDAPAWRGTRWPEVEVADLARELHLSDEAEAGRLSRRTLPREIRPLNYKSNRMRRENFRRFLAHVDPQLLPVLRQGWAMGSWPFFQLCVASERARDMACGDNAMLVWLLASSSERYALPRRRRDFAERWLARPRKELAARLGLPAQKSSLALLRKVPPADAEPQVFDRLHVAANDGDTRKLLFHAERLTAPFLFAVQPAVRQHVHPSFLAQLTGVTDVHRGGRILSDIRDTLRLAIQLHVKFKKLTSLEHLKEAHNTLVDKARVVQTQKMLEPFPPPPVQLTDDERRWATPILDAVSLTAEGAAMRHCLGQFRAHHQWASNGDFYAWHLSQPEPHTLALRRTQGWWRLYDLRRACNGEPRRELLRWAKGLVERANQGATPPTSPPPFWDEAVNVGEDVLF